MFHGHLNCFQKSLLGGRPNTKLGDHSIPNSHSRWFIFYYSIMCEGTTWIEFHWNSTWLRARSHMTSHCTWGPVMTLYDFNSDLGRPLNTSLGLPQFHGHECWLMCEVALIVTCSCSVTDTKCIPLSFLVGDLGHHIYNYKLSIIVTYYVIVHPNFNHPCSISFQIWNSST